MAGPSIIIPTFFRGAPGVTQLAARPVRPGWRPYTERTRGKRPNLLTYGRNSANAAPVYATVGVLGTELPYPTEGQGVDSLGRLLPGFSAFVSGTPTPGIQAGSFVETITLSGGVGTGIGMITVLDGGADITAAPTVVFTPATGAPAATAVIRDRRVVGINITAAGGPFTTPPVITFTGGGNMTRAPVATCGIGQVTTINTHIPHAVHTPLAYAAYPAQNYVWFLEVLGLGSDRIIPCSTSIFSATADDGALDPDQHINESFTEATGTHPDGTPTIGVLTLTRGLPNNTRVRAYACPVREISAQAVHNFDVTQVRGLDLMWAVIGGAGDNTNTSITLMPHHAG